MRTLRMALMLRRTLMVGAVAVVVVGGLGEMVVLAEAVEAEMVVPV